MQVRKKRSDFSGRFFCINEPDKILFFYEKMMEAKTDGDKIIFYHNKILDKKFKCYICGGMEIL